MLLDILGAGFVEVKISVENAPIPIEVLISGGIYAYAMIAELRQMGATVNFIAAAFDRDLTTLMKQDGAVTTQTAYEALVSKGESYVEAYNNLPRITKEQFYDLSN